jgi:hypothetical protein
VVQNDRKRRLHEQKVLSNKFAKTSTQAKKPAKGKKNDPTMTIKQLQDLCV